MTEALRFAHISTFFPPHGFGGDAVQVHRLASGLGERHHSVSVSHAPAAFDAGGPGSLKGFPQPAGVTILPTPVGRRGLVASYLAGRPLGFRRDLEAAISGADVVHFHNPSLIGGPGAILLAHPDQLVVYTAHEHWLVCPMHVLFRNRCEPCERKTCFTCSLRHRRPPQPWRWSSLLGRAMQRVDLLLTPSEFTAERHRAELPHVPIEVLRNPPPAPRAVPVDKRESRSGRAYVLFAGRLEPVKGARFLVEALLDDLGIDVVLAGDGTERAAIERLVADRPHVRLVGTVPHDEMLALCRGALALVVPSVGYESSGAVAIEAMSVGTPVLVRDLGALPELVEKGGGLVFRDSAGLRREVLQLRDDPALRDRLAAEAAAIADPVAGDRQFFGRYFSLIADAAARTGREDIATRAADASRLEEGP